MMMEVLQAGGLIIDESPRAAQLTLDLMRLPNGMHENHQNIVAGKFENSFKLANIRYLDSVPDDYRFIFMGRALPKILASWNAVIERFAEHQADVTTLIAARDKAESQYPRWQKILTDNATKFLVLDYDTVVKDPTKEIARVASWVNTTEFKFDEKAAAAVVNPEVYINR
jgi:hypothetical protein